MSDPSTIIVTRRESLRWVPGEPFNDTDVLVLTIGKFFLDLRVFTSGPSKGEIDWSMGGVCLPLPGTTESRMPTRFLNIIDQRALASAPHPQLPSSLVNPEEEAQNMNEPTPDDVVFTPIPDTETQSKRSLESGKMPNPAIDAETYVPFEEVWQELDIPEGSSAAILETLGDDGVGKAYTGVIGSWRMGLMDDGKGNYLAWRDDKVDGKWTEVYTFGESARSVIPIIEVVEQSWEEGNVVEYHGRKWVVRGVAY